MGKGVCRDEKGGGILQTKPGSFQGFTGGRECGEVEGASKSCEFLEGDGTRAILMTVCHQASSSYRPSREHAGEALH